MLTKNCRWDGVALSLTPGLLQTFSLRTSDAWRPFLSRHMISNTWLCWATILYDRCVKTLPNWFYRLCTVLCTCMYASVASWPLSMSLLCHAQVMGYLSSWTNIEWPLIRDKFNFLSRYCHLISPSKIQSHSSLRLCQPIRWRLDFQRWPIRKAARLMGGLSGIILLNPFRE